AGTPTYSLSPSSNVLLSWPPPLLRSKRGVCSGSARGATERAPEGALSIQTDYKLGRDRDQIAQRSEPRQRLALELPDALARQVELVADRLERPRLALEAEPQLEDPPLPLGERVQCLPHALPAERLLRLVERIGGLAVGEEIAELALVVRADRLVQRDRRVGGGECLVDVLDRQAGRLGELLLRRLAPELDLEAP